ncbi:MAG: hypothetical protein HQL45_07500 [Alphaproteobacteria bacterium]|nr:hypothetical protein [Alphaproteobacteria bacterium]MBF0356678.1 hypothetical protein [Alphaproteobacteria bacterium]
MSVPPAIFNWITREVILTQYVTRLAQACRIIGIPFDQVDYAEAELRRAIDETDIDLSAMFQRRSKEHGISTGKVAGLLAYRLSRFKILHFSEVGQQQLGTVVLQELTALLLVEAHLLRWKLPQNTVVELAYQMSRRHANQETLGVVFDTLHQALPSA